MSKIQYYNLKSPATAQLELTFDCTNRCIYCYNYWRYGEKPGERLSLEQSKKILDELVNAEVFELVLTGGEPLMRKDLLYPLIEQSGKEGILTKINTNLVLLEDDDVRKLRDLPVDGVLVSLASHNSDTYNRITQTKMFSKVVNNLEKLVANGIKCAVSMVVLNQNRHDVYETGKLVHNMGLRSFCATPISPCSKTHKDLELSSEDIENTLISLNALKRDFGMYVDVLEPIPFCILKKPGDYGSLIERDCSAGRLTVTITPAGEVRPCTHVSKNYGSLFSDSLKNIWEKMGEWRDGSLMPEKCEPCVERTRCSMGCREAANVYYQDYRSEDPVTVGHGPLSASIEKARNIAKIDENCQYRVRKDVKYREESGNYLLFMPATYTMTIINKEFFALLSNLSRRENFTMREIGDVHDIFSFLLHKGIIEKT